MNNVKKGIWSLIPNYEVLILLAKSKGVSFIIFDLEHGGWSIEDLPLPIRYLRSINISSIIRIGSATQELIQKSVDCDPDYVQISGLESTLDYSKATERFHSKPKGSRGYSPWSFNSIFSQSSDPAKLILQVESKDAINNFINFVSSTDQKPNHIFIGRYDLSCSLNVPGELTHPLVADNFHKIFDFCTNSGISVSTICLDAAEYAKFKRLKLNMISISSDRQIILEGLDSLTRSLT